VNAPQLTPPAFPPVTLLLDPDDDRACYSAAYGNADPRAGRILVDPTPHTRSLGYLALDILRAMGRDSFQRAQAERLTTDPAWRAVTCWTLTTGLRQVTIVRAHLLTDERLRRLATWRADTGIHLRLLAHIGKPADADSLRLRLKAAGLGEAGETVQGTAAVVAALGPAATKRSGPPAPDRAYPLHRLPHSGPLRFRADCWRTLNSVDFAHADGQYRAGYAAARTWLTRTWLARVSPHQQPTVDIVNGPDADHGRDPEPAPWQDIEGLRFFLSRLTTCSPSLQHTQARVRGAQAGFLAEGLLLEVPDDLAACGGPGVTTVPYTPRIAHWIGIRLPSPARAAAAAALLFTGTSSQALARIPIGSVDAACTRIVRPLDPTVVQPTGEIGGPSHVYAIPARARPVIRAAVEFRRRTPRTADGMTLFAKCFGTSDRFRDLIADAGYPVPALLHPHLVPDWHHQARCWHLNTPPIEAPTYLPPAGTTP
jgi:hypothetical protein